MHSSVLHHLNMFYSTDRQHLSRVLRPTACNQSRLPQGEARASRGTDSDGDSVDSQSTREAQRQCSGASGAPTAHITLVQ